MKWSSQHGCLIDPKPGWLIGLPPRAFTLFGGACSESDRLFCFLPCVCRKMHFEQHAGSAPGVQQSASRDVGGSECNVRCEVLTNHVGVSGNSTTSTEVGRVCDLRCYFAAYILVQICQKTVSTGRRNLVPITTQTKRLLAACVPFCINPWRWQTNSR